MNELLGLELLEFPEPAIIQRYELGHEYQGFRDKYKVTRHTKTQDGPNRLCKRWAMLKRVLKA